MQREDIAASFSLQSIACHTTAEYAPGVRQPASVVLIF